MNTKPLIALLLITTIPLTGCTTFWRGLSGAPNETAEASSLMQFLYPDGNYDNLQTDATPSLELPLRVGVGFVPTSHQGPYSHGTLSEKRRQELLRVVRDEFNDEKFIAHIELIPDVYMRSGAGFTTLDQLARLYDLDVVALLSYDQVVYTENNGKSLLYWTLLGTYFIDGTENEVHTFVDAAVFDVATHKLLFRAGGIAQERRESNLTNLDEVVRVSKSDGFDIAIGDLTTNLALALEQFRARVRNEEIVRVSYGGGGSVGWLALFALVVLSVSTAHITKLHAAKQNSLEGIGATKPPIRQIHFVKSLTQKKPHQNRCGFLLLT